MHRIRGVQNRQVPIQREAVVGGAPNLIHAEVPISTLGGVDDSACVSIERAGEVGARPGACQMFDQRQQRSFSIVERDVIHIVERARVRETSEFRVRVTASKSDCDIGPACLYRLGDSKGAVEIAGKWHCQTDERWIQSIEMVPQGVEHESIRERRLQAHGLNDGLE